MFNKVKKFVYHIIGVKKLDTNKYKKKRLDRLFSYADIKNKFVENCIREINNNSLLKEAQKKLSNYEERYPVPRPHCVSLYVLARKYRPEISIETGVRHGESTMYILAALRENSTGRLYSIDVPSVNLPDGENPGWAVPDEFGERWDLTVGKSQDHLEEVLEEAGGVDFFFHDSWHKYPLMSWEFDNAFEEMENGIICAHDVNRNQSFLEICERANSTINVDRKFKIGGKGVFGFAYVGDKMREDGIRGA